jgi:hypothetical protein
VAQGSLHPAGSLYEKPVNTNHSIEQHRHFVEVLEENGACAHTRAWAPVCGCAPLYDRPCLCMCIRAWVGGVAGVLVVDVREILMLDTDTSVGARLRLEEFAATRLEYRMDPSCAGRARPGDDYYVSAEYKHKVLRAMSSEQLVDIVMTNPTVTILPSGRDTHFTAAYAFQPLSNVVFTRDQQVTTRKVAPTRPCSD